MRKLNPAVPVDLATIVTKSLAKDPANRYETAWQLADELERFLDGRPIAARPVGALARTWRWCRRKPVQAALAAGLLVSLAGGLAGITWNWREAVRQRQELRCNRKSCCRSRSGRQPRSAIRRKRSAPRPTRSTGS